MSDLLCCTAGTTIAFKSNYTPMEKKKKTQPTSSWKLTIGQLLTHNYAQIIIWGIALW